MITKTKKRPPFKMEKGGLRKTLKPEKGHKFTIKELEILRKKIEKGKPFKYNGNTIKPTLKLKRQVIFGKNLMVMSKNWRMRKGKK